MADRNYQALLDPDRIDTVLDMFLEKAAGTSFEKPKPFAFDIETGYHGADRENIAKMHYHPDYVVVGVSFTFSTDWAVYVPLNHDDGGNTPDVPRFLRKFWRLLQTGMGVAHNVAFELKGMSRIFREILWRDPEIGAEIREEKGLFPFYADTMLLVWLSQEYEPAISDITQKDLKKSVQMRFGLIMTHFEQLFPKEESDMGPATKGAQGKLRFNTRNSRSQRVISYACEDSVGSLMLLEEHYEPVAKGDRKFICDVEHDLVRVLVEMEMGPVDPETGVAQGNMYLNWAHIFKKAEEVERFRDYFAEEIQEEFSERLGRMIELNLGSSQQMAKILFDPFPQGLGLSPNKRYVNEETGTPSTSEDALKVIANSDPLVRKILTYRQVAKLFSSYLNKYATELNYAGTGFVFPSHNQAGTVTGRMSVDGVSYQQWPKPQTFKLKDGTILEMNFRDLLISPPGYRIIGYDYSQVELRFLAAVAGETSMLAAFADGTDIHKLTASRMFKIPIDQVDKKSRGKGKTLNFGIVYQQGADALAESLTANGTPTTTEEAQELLDQYYAGFPLLRAWMDEQVGAGHNQGWVETFFKRKFTVWEFNDPRQYIRKKGDRMCINAPIQGGAADYMKIAMVRVYRKLKELGIQDKVRLTMTIHDALEFYVHESIDTQYVIDVINPCVSYAVAGLPVQIRADWHQGPTWGALAEIKLDKNAQIAHYELDDVDEEFATYEDAMAFWFARQAEEDAKPKRTVANIPVPKLTLARLYKNHKVTPTRQKKIRELAEEGAKEPTPTMAKIIESIGGMDLVRRLVAEEKADAAAEAPAPGPISQKTIASLSDGSGIQGMIARVEQLESADTAPAPEEEDAPWMAHHKPKLWVVTMTEMPTTEQWNDFKAWLPEGKDRLEVVTPEGTIRDDKTYRIEAEDQGIISLLLGGVDLTAEALAEDYA